MRPIATLSLVALSFFLGAACAPDLDGLFGPPGCEPGYAGSPPTCQAQGGTGLGGSATDAGPDAPAPDCHLTCQLSVSGACCGCPAGCSPGIPDGMCEDGLSCSDFDGGAGGGDSSGDGGGQSGSGGSDAGAACAHSPCEAGGTALDPACDPCVAQVCATDPACCDSAWGAPCAQYVDTICGDGGYFSVCGKSGTCSHGICEKGAALNSNCNLCVYVVCEKYPGCCTTGWAQACADAVVTDCQLPCP